MHPVGPLPASVYWRRRACAVGVALLALFALLWLTTWLLIPRGSDEPAGTAARTTPQSSQTTPDTGTAAPAPPPGSPSPASPAPGTG
ncbi:MucR family transcriptional regulator, partial [Pseudonocardia alni]|nr:MucR family transcriptional regulator [Pseudonocardia alni]